MEPAKPTFYVSKTHGEYILMYGIGADACMFSIDQRGKLTSWGAKSSSPYYLEIHTWTSPTINEAIDGAVQIYKTTTKAIRFGRRGSVERLNMLTYVADWINNMVEP